MELIQVIGKRKRNYLVYFLALVLIIVSCNQIKFNPKTEKEVEKMAEKSVSLNVKIRIEGKFLIVEYEVCNMSKVTIYLMNHLFRLKKTGGWDVPDRNLVYVYPEDKGVIRLAKWVPPIPEDLLSEEIRPYATALNVGEKWVEELRLELPLKPFVPYHGREYNTDKWKIVTYKYIYFTLGFYPHTENVQITRKDIGGVDVLAIGGIPAYGEGQQLLESEKINLPVEVLIPRRW